MTRRGLVAISGISLALVVSACGSDTTSSDDNTGGVGGVSGFGGASTGGTSFGGTGTGNGGAIPGSGGTVSGSGGSVIGNGGTVSGSGGVDTGSGGASSGGAASGGAAGSASGGASNGGASSGGASSGGASSGGASNGGASNGGASSGGAGNGGSAGAGTGGAGTGGAGTGGAGTGGAGTGGAGTGGAGTGGAGTGGAGAGGAGGVAGGGGTGGGNPGIDLTGTWISEVKTSGQLAVPLVGMTAANIDLIIALQLSKAAGKLNGVFSICKLTTVTTPNASSLTVQFTPKVISTLTTTMSENDFTAMVGQPVPVPALEILSGETAGGVSVDADADNHPGVTIPSNIGGILPINAYVGLDIKVAMKATTLTNANTITGTTSFTTDGKVFGSNNALLTTGTISVTPSSSSIAFTATKLAGAVACSDVLTHF